MAMIMDIIVILIATTTITMILDIPMDITSVTGMILIMNLGMDPVMGDEIMGQGGRIILGRINLTRTETGDKLLMMYKEKTRLFDEWPEAYDRWFTTPIGSLVRKYEVELIMDLLKPKRSEVILDAGCGTGVFTRDILLSGSRVVGLDISSPMLIQAGKKLKGFPFQMVLGDMLNLPFRESSFDKVVSVTALEFIEDARDVVGELFRVTERGGAIVVATLNSLSPWALRRKAEAKERHTIF